MSKSPTITKVLKSKARIPRDPNRRPPPIHPGEVLLEEFMLPHKITGNALAIALRVPATRISEIVRKRRSITGDTAFRLSVYFGTSAELWMNLQKNYELALVEHGNLTRIREEVQVRRA